MLEEIGQIVTGKTPSSNVIGAFSSSGIPFVTPKDMDGRRWIETTERYLSEAGRQSLKNYLIPKDSVAVSCIGSDMGKAILLKKDSVTNQQINTIIVDASKHNPKYIYYVLSLKQEELKSIAGGSATPILNKGHFSKVVIELPDKVDQDNIVQVLDSLDCKIELNNQINQNLESMAQAMFKSWFIDFDPVRAKIAAKQEGKDSELAAMCAISGKSEAELEQMAKEDFAELQATAALFPDELVESELGEVPKGWTLTLLKDVTTELRRGISPKYTEEPNGAIVINQKCIRNHTINFSLARKHNSSKRKIDGRELQIGDVLVNSTGVGTLGRIASVRYLDSITVVDSHVTVVRANDKKVSRAYLQGLLLENEKFIEASGAGTTGQTELRKEVLQEIKFPNPAVALHQQFDSIIYKINQEIANLEKMNISLSHVRDTLLPKLLSGEMDAALLKG
ncbi:restriction endonuclease subunit S [Acinetobacter radioresistens]|uniref:restriction endonuclease subunit S n=1 Tax=Acinetobacter radioresistens TaxID=40216 RepID=UPI003A802A2E